MPNVIYAFFFGMAGVSAFLFAGIILMRTNIRNNRRDGYRSKEK